jgi:hypothetical protein
MKRIYLPTIALTLAAAAHAGDAPSVQLPGDCEDQVRLASAAANMAEDYSFNKNEDGSITISAADLASVVIKNVVIVKQHTNPINEHSETTYGANLDSTKQYNKIAGKVQVTSTRGGCFINSLKF